MHCKHKYIVLACLVDFFCITDRVAKIGIKKMVGWKRMGFGVIFFPVCYSYFQNIIF